MNESNRVIISPPLSAATEPCKEAMRLGVWTPALVSSLKSSAYFLISHHFQFPIITFLDTRIPFLLWRRCARVVVSHTVRPRGGIHTTTATTSTTATLAIIYLYLHIQHLADALMHSVFPHRQCCTVCWERRLKGSRSHPGTVARWRDFPLTLHIL